MLRMKCESCGKYYDYDADESCPKCGSYNKPPHRASAGFEKRQSREVDPGWRSNGPGKTTRTTEDAKATTSGRSTGHLFPKPPASGKAKKRHPLAAGLGVLIVFLGLLLPLPFGKSSSEVDVTTISEVNIGEITHEFGETFSISEDVVFSISGGGVIMAEDGLTNLPDGMMCIYLDATLTSLGGADALDAEMTEPCLWYDEDTCVTAGTDGLQLEEELAEYGVSVLNLSNSVVHESLFGQIVFIVPEDSTDFAFCIEQLGEGSEVIYIHRVEFYLE